MNFTKHMMVLHVNGKQNTMREFLSYRGPEQRASQACSLMTVRKISYIFVDVVHFSSKEISIQTYIAEVVLMQ